MPSSVPPSSSGSKRERILVRGVNWIGDAVMTTPALQRLREAKPQASITLLTPQKLAELWRHHPSVDAVLTFTREESVFQIGRRLQKEGFDLALVLPNSPRSALEVFLARIPVRIGGAAPWRNFLLTRAIPPRPEAIAMRKRSAAEIKKLVRQTNPGSPARIPNAAHQIHHYLNLAAVLGASREPLTPRIYISEAEIHAFKKRFNILPEPGERRPWFGLNPGAEYGPAKRWPAERFISAAQELQQRTQCRWLIFGGGADVPLATRIAAGLSGPAMNLAGQTSLRELCAALKICAVLVTNDSGPMHLAAALGTPVVAAFGSTSPELTGPGLPGHQLQAVVKTVVACAPCFRRQCPIDLRCMNGITVDAIVMATLRVAREDAAPELRPSDGEGRFL